MPKFSVEKQESKTVKHVTFNKESDYTAIFLIDKETGKPETKVRLVHNVQAEKLIAQNKAVAAKSVSIKESEKTVVSTKKIDKK